MASSASKPKQQAPAPAYVPPTIQPPAYTPPPPPAPAPDAPTPYMVQQESEAAMKGDTQAKNLSRARVGRSALKINLVNSGDDGSSSGINTTN